MHPGADPAPSIGSTADIGGCEEEAVVGAVGQVPAGDLEWNIGCRVPLGGYHEHRVLLIPFHRDGPEQGLVAQSTAALEVG